VSSYQQGRHGTSLKEQEKAVREAGAQVIISDVYTGTKMERPHFSELLNKLQSGDKLIVTKLDRFARTASEGGAIVSSLHNQGVTIHILNMGIADASPMGKLMVNILLSFAEFERDQIVERTQSGKAAARAQGRRVDGRPLKFQKAQREHALHLLEHYSYSQVASMTGISTATLTRYKRQATILSTT